MIGLLLLSTTAFGYFLNVFDTKIARTKYGDEFRIKGITFNNNCRLNVSVGETDHELGDYYEVGDIGFNTVRFLLSYRFFEDDNAPYQYKESVWKWITNEIEAAKRYGISLILEMEVPQGGISDAKEYLLLDQSKIDRFYKLWVEIARRFKKSKTVIGFGLLNKPIGVWRGSAEASILHYKNFFEKAIELIREVDTNHIIFFQSPNVFYTQNFVKMRSELDKETGNFVLLSDEKVIYETNFYEPLSFTQQNSKSETEDFTGRYVTYPDYSTLFAIGGPNPNNNIDNQITQMNTQPEVGVWNKVGAHFNLLCSGRCPESILSLVIHVDSIGENGYVVFKLLKIKEFSTSEEIHGIHRLELSDKNVTFETTNGGNYTFIQNCDDKGNVCLKIYGVKGKAKCSGAALLLGSTTRLYDFEIEVYVQTDEKVYEVYPIVQQIKYDKAFYFDRWSLFRYLDQAHKFKTRRSVPMERWRRVGGGCF
ncbi:hypothetical protein EIN_178700 [Entamoeba invadens IP1]|uniref:hypothetical protein n=1 Tax=Entamoeba invadens IP1 TaxID=370355 RepID=UPI0002C3F0D9|nr:hypothetical protein EIN_178700 [Entamoeba invadens IP1]ELP93913.1 hypothetical protein EIN_178700 [Entamoeba invadens IP1]|eukprot:XP_004260684.1 hypothetical protein EIN_178700 [Entamoeba invadens IP1]